MRIAAFTMVFNEPLFLRLWAAHYGREVGADNLFCLDHGSTDGSATGVVANTIRLPRGEFAEVPRARCVSHYQASLLAYYDAVIFSDADEFLVADPARYAGLGDFIARSGQATVRAVGCDVVQVTGEEAPLDPGQPILGQRGFAKFNPRYCKPLVSRVPLTWRPGFHHCTQPASIDPDLYLFHLKFADAALFHDTQAKRLSVTWSAEAIASQHGGHWRVPAQGLAARAFPKTAPPDAPELGEASFRALLAEEAAARDPARLREPFRIPARFRLSIPPLPPTAGTAKEPEAQPPTGTAEEPEAQPPAGAAADAAPPDEAPPAQPQVERNRALLRAFVAMPTVYEAEPAIEHHAGAVLLPSLRMVPMADPAIRAECGDWPNSGTAVDGGAYTAAGAIIPRALHRAGGRVHMPRPDMGLALDACGPALRTPVTQRGRWLYGGSLHHHFGHFMMESLGRLWAMDALRDWAEGIVWTLASPRPGNGARFASVTLQRSYIRDTLRLLGLGDRKLHVVIRPTIFEELAVPSVLMLNATPDVAAGHAVFRDFVRRMGADGQPGGAVLPGLYVSRAGLIPAARFAAEDALEQAFARAGWEVLRPEERSVPDQIALYRAARQLVFAEGSALHLYAYVARPDQRVGIILRRLPPKPKFAQQLHGFGVAEVHVADAIAGMALPEDPVPTRGRSAAANSGATVLDYRRLGDWMVEHGFLSPAERAMAWGLLDALPLPAEAPAGTIAGPFMVPRAVLMPARARTPKPAATPAPPPPPAPDGPFPNPEAAP